MRRRLLAEARRGGGALFVKKNYGYAGSCAAFQRFKCNYLASECEDKVQGLEEKMGSLHTEIQGLRAEVSALHQGAAAWWANIDKHLLQAPLKKKITSLHDDMRGLISDTASLIRGDIDSQRASVESSLSDLQKDMSKGQIEQIDLCMRISEKQSSISADITAMRRQASEDTEALQKSLRTSHDDVLAFESSLKDMVEQLKCESAKIAPYYIEAAKIGSLQEQVTEVYAILASLGGFTEQMAKEIKEDMTGLRADVAKACHTETDGNPLICQCNNKIDLVDRRMSAHYANILSKLCSINGMEMVIKELKADMALLVAKGSADMAEVEKCLSKIMHAEMEHLYRIVATTKGDVLIRSNVIAQEKSIMEAQELSHKLLSNVESYANNATDMERANAIFVKFASTILGCTTALYAWIAWSSYSCYPF